MTTNDLLLDIYYWMEFKDEEELMSELRDTDPDERPKYKEFSEMLSRCIGNLKEVG